MALLELGTPVPIRFFDHPSKAHYLQRYCRGMHEHHIHYAHDKIPPIFFVRDTSASSTFPVSFINLATGTTTNLTPTFTILTVGTRDYCFGPPNTSIPTLGGLACGKYRMEITDGASTYYSEHFNISDQTSSMLKWSWNDTCARFGVPWQDAPSGFRFHFYVDGTVGAPVDTTEEDVFDNGTEQTVTQSRTARRTLFQDLIPDFLVDCFHAMHHHASVQLTVPVPASTSPAVAATTTVLNVKVHDIATAYGRRACLTETSVYFEIYAEARSGCCDGDLAVVPCCDFDATFDLKDCVDNEREVGITVASGMETCFDLTTVTYELDGGDPEAVPTLGLVPETIIGPFPAPCILVFRFLALDGRHQCHHTVNLEVSACVSEPPPIS